MNASHVISDELLSAYLDGEMDEAAMARVERALRQDPLLRERLQGLQEVVALLHDAPQVVTPRTLTVTVEQALAAGAYVQGAGASSWWARWRGRLMPVATAMVAVLLLVSLFMPTAMRLSKAPSGLTRRMKVTRVVEKEVVQEAPAILQEHPLALATARPSQPPASSQTRGVAPSQGVPSSAVPSPKSRTAAGRATPEASQDQIAALAAEPEAEVRGLSAQAPAENPAPTRSSFSLHVSLLSWFLALLLVVMLFLTWRISWRR